LDVMDIYVLNLMVTVAMFLVLIFRAWIELKNYRVIWSEIGFKKTMDLIRKVLRAERDSFLRVEGGRELYDLLCKVFEVEGE
jgi:hypothetical protein